MHIVTRHQRADDEEVPDVLVGVTARESDALEHLHLLLWGQRRLIPG